MSILAWGLLYFIPTFVSAKFSPNLWFPVADSSAESKTDHQAPRIIPLFTVLISITIPQCKGQNLLMKM